MSAEQAIEKFTAGQPFRRIELMEAIRDINPAYSDNSLKWLISKLKAEHKIEKIGRDVYYRTSPDKMRKNYVYPHSDSYIKLASLLEKQYPLLTFQMWETVQMNEFVNHQLAHNAIIIDVEKDIIGAAFETLRGAFVTVLQSPTQEEYYRYRSEDDTVIVQNLIAAAPAPIAGTHSCRLEKIIVDLFSSKITGSLISKGEYPGILEEMFSKYVIDETKLFRYADRRRNREKIREFITAKTNVKLTERR